MSKQENKAEAFVRRMRDDEAFREEIIAHLGGMEEGEWDRIVAVAKDRDYRFTKAELIAAVPEGFYRGKGSNPEVGWSEATRAA